MCSIFIALPYKNCFVLFLICSNHFRLRVGQGLVGPKDKIKLPYFNGRRDTRLSLTTLDFTSWSRRKLASNLLHFIPYFMLSVHSYRWHKSLPRRPPCNIVGIPAFCFSPIIGDYIFNTVASLECSLSSNAFLESASTIRSPPWYRNCQLIRYSWEYTFLYRLSSHWLYSPPIRQHLPLHRGLSRLMSCPHTAPILHLPSWISLVYLN